MISGIIIGVEILWEHGVPKHREEVQEEETQDDGEAESFGVESNGSDDVLEGRRQIDNPEEVDTEAVGSVEDTENGKEKEGKTLDGTWSRKTKEKFATCADREAEITRGTEGVCSIDDTSTHVVAVVVIRIIVVVVSSIFIVTIFSSVILVFVVIVTGS